MFAPALLKVSNPASILQRAAAKHAMAFGRDTIKLVLCYVVRSLDDYSRETSVSPAILCVCGCICLTLHFQNRDLTSE